jgi:excisionase family DNA binding protein
MAAAELLGLSRPFVARLLERGDIPSELLPGSRHRRIKLEDVLAVQDRRVEARRAGFCVMVGMSGRRRRREGRGPARRTGGQQPVATMLPVPGVDGSGV